MKVSLLAAQWGLLAKEVDQKVGVQSDGSVGVMRFGASPASALVIGDWSFGKIARVLLALWCFHRRTNAQQATTCGGGRSARRTWRASSRTPA